MIRMFLYAAGFVAVTLMLVLMQPGSATDQAAVTQIQDVSRDATPLTGPLNDRLDSILSDQVQGDQIQNGPPPGSRNVAATTDAMPAAASSQTDLAADTSVQRTAPQDVSLTPDAQLRNLTWTTLSRLNAATGQDAAPGREGSMLNMIVRRSLEVTSPAPAPQSVTAPPPQDNRYTVQPGDSLAGIALKLYGDVNMTGPLFALNQTELPRANALRAGQVLVLPER